VAHSRVSAQKLREQGANKAIYVKNCAKNVAICAKCDEKRLYGNSYRQTTQVTEMSVVTRIGDH
jgi:hypothetical protein